MVSVGSVAVVTRTVMVALNGVKLARNVKSEAEGSLSACLAVGAGALVREASSRHGVSKFDNRIVFLMFG